jgi:hypothetical protein
MDPALAIPPIHSQHARPDSPTLSMDQAFIPAGDKDVITDNYINISNARLNMTFTENGNGKYHTLNTKIWKLIDTDAKTDERGRIHLNRDYIGTEPSVFVADDYQEPETCKYYVILSKSKWFEVRKVRGVEAGEPLEIQKNGDIWTGHKNKFVKVFIKEAK